MSLARVTTLEQRLYDAIFFARQDAIAEGRAITTEEIVRIVMSVLKEQTNQDEARKT